MANTRAVQAPLIRRITSWVLALLIFGYVGFQVYQANTEMIHTETATYIETADSFSVEGVFIRKETVITADYSGDLGYELSDGSHVAKDGVVAKAYPEGSPVNVEDEIETVESEIESLQTLLSLKDSYAADPSQLDQNAEKQMLTLLKELRSGEEKDAKTARQELLYTLNEKQIVTGAITDFSDRIAELQARKSELESQKVNPTSTVKSPASGYFSSVMDGWETVYDYDQVEDLTADDLKQERQPEAVDSSAVGRVVTEYEWYFACVVDADTALKLKGTSSVTLSLKSATEETFPAQVVTVNQTSQQDDAAVIFSSDIMDETLINTRQATVTVNRGNYQGVQVNQKAIHFADITEEVEDEEGNVKTVTHENVQGVYVVESGKLKFVQIFPLLTLNGYVICDVDLSDSQKEKLYTDRTVELYDEVVVGGHDLYDGRVIN